MVRPPRAVLFDADGVLQRTADWREDLGEAVADVDDRRTGQLLDDLAGAEGPPTLTGEADLDRSLTHVLDRYEEVDLPVEAVHDAWHAIELHEDVLDGVRRLAGRGLVLALTTNQNEPRAAWMRENLPYDELFDAHFYSCEVGLAKPDPAYFTHVLEALDVAPEDALFLDDTAVNVEAAAGLGIRAELFARDAGRVELERILALHGLA